MIQMVFESTTVCNLVPCLQKSLKKWFCQV